MSVNVSILGNVINHGYASNRHPTCSSKGEEIAVFAYLSGIKLKYFRLFSRLEFGPMADGRLERLKGSYN